MVSFVNDYSEGCHPDILRRLAETNLEQAPGYGSDRFTASAREKIRAAAGCPEADVFFLSGGTQTNATVIASLLRPYEGVIAAATGHIAVHEAGAVEYTGHKVITLPQRDGKFSPADLRTALSAFHADPSHAHMAAPGMVYLSFPTEYGTLYTLDELRAIRAVCDTYGLPLYVDGARLGYGLASAACETDLPGLAALCDVFYIGGTKVGALCGEAVVFPRGNAPEGFFTSIKQHGALLAKGRLTALQFDVLFTDGLYFRLGENGVRRAMQVRDLFRAHGYEMYLDSPTNQQFVVLDAAQKERISRHAAFDTWENLPDGRTVVRFATSWATTQEQVDSLAEALRG
jgi:threonine aldolase